jgi:hypothetical protein
MRAIVHRVRQLLDPRAWISRIARSDLIQW